MNMRKMLSQSAGARYQIDETDSVYPEQYIFPLGSIAHLGCAEASIKGMAQKTVHKFCVSERGQPLSRVCGGISSR